MKDILTWFSTLGWIAENYKKGFYTIFRFKADKNFVAEHYEIDFVMMFHIKVAQNMVAQHYERDFEMLVRWL